MNTTIKCKHCGKEIEISEALQHEIEGQVLTTEREKHQKELIEVRQKAEQEAIDKSKRDFAFQLETLQKEKEEEKQRNTKLLKELENLNVEIRNLRRRDEERELDMKKRLANEEEKIRQEARKKAFEEGELKDREKDKKLQDALRQIEELKSKIQQGSQQTQGEVLELELEEILKREFPDDEISEIKKGQRGADISQKVIDPRGRECGSILWESKNAQWSEGWLSKLRQDQRSAKAQIAVLVATNTPDDIENFTYRDGVWITRRGAVIGLAMALRLNLISLFSEKMNKSGKEGKMEVLYQYLTSTEFRHRVEGIVEAFTNLQKDIEKERRWFTTKWARQEKEIRKIVDNTQGMYGDLQSATGRELPQIKSLELPVGEEDITE